MDRFLSGKSMKVEHKPSNATFDELESPEVLNSENCD